MAMNFAKIAQKDIYKEKRIITMDEKNTKTIIECLAETVRRLEIDNFILKGDNDRLREKIAQYEKNTEEVGKKNA